MRMFNALIARINRDEEGQGLAEYALILALIAIVAIVALIFLGNQVSRSCRRSATRSSHGSTVRRSDDAGCRSWQPAHCYQGLDAHGVELDRMGGRSPA